MRRILRRESGVSACVRNIKEKGSDVTDYPDDDEEEPADCFCHTCGGSGGGWPPFDCKACRGTGRSRVHDQELADRRAEEMRDRRIDNELMNEREG